MTMKRLLALTLALGACLLSGCSKGDGSSSAAASSPAASSSPDASSSAAAPVEPMDLSAVTDPYLATAGMAGDTAAAKAGEYDIAAADLLYWLNYGIEMYQSQAGSDAVPDWETAVGDVTLGEYLTQSALETAAFYRLIPEIAEQEGLALSQEDLDYLAEDLAAGEEQLGGAEMLDHILWYQLRTREQYSDSYKVGVLYSLLQDKYYGEDSDAYPTDAEVRSYADEQGYYKVKHILLSNKGEDGETPLDDAAAAEKKAQADDLLAQLRAAGDPIALFDELMNQYSEDPGLASYPDGYDAYKGQMVPEFETASLALKEGEISEVVESAHGWHIILRLPLELETFRSQLIAEKMEERTDGWLEEYPTETTAAWDALDLTEFRNKVSSLQAAVEEEVQAQQADGSASSSGGAG